MPPRPRFAFSSLGLALLCAACFDPAIRETLYLDFAPNGILRITAEVELSALEAETNAALKRRLEEAERALLDGTDPWSARFGALDPAAERFGWEKRLGQLRSMRRAAMVIEPEDLARFFDRTDVAASYRIDAELGLAELTFAPGSSSRAGRRERRAVEEALAQWSEILATYLRRVAELYAYLEEHPERDHACLGNLYEDLLGESDKAALPAPTAGEEELLDRLGESMVQVWSVLQVGEGEEMSLDELARLVFDPFPARLEVSLPAAALEAEGFAELAEGRLEVPELGLWAAFGRLAGRWAQPDPALAFMQLRKQAEEEPIPLATLLAPGRSFASDAELPSSGDLHDALAAELTPAFLYRAVWAVQPEVEPPVEWRE